VSSLRAFLFGLICADIHEDVKLIRELPLAEKTDIGLTVTEDSLIISVDNSRHWYLKEVKLLAMVNPQRAKSNYKNGIPEASIMKKYGKKRKGELVKTG
jgi:HSP20 family molecular chaperone IbpA